MSNLLGDRINSCQLFEEKKCPKQLLLEGTNPIPQLLETKQFQECQQLARSCKHDMLIEDRQHPRMPIKLPARIITAAAVIEGETENISLYGALIRCQKPLEPGRRLMVIAKLPYNPSFNSHAEVVWTSMPRPHGKGVSCGMGVKFID